MENKRGLSPVIATTLLILIAVVLAVIIFLWVKTFIGEKVQKDLGGGPEPIESFCSQVGFNGEVSSTTNSLTIVNNKDVPIYGIEIRKKSLASKKVLCMITSPSGGITSGEDQQGMSAESCTLTAGDEVILVPVLVGQSGTERKAYSCDETYGVQTQVV